MNNDKYRLIAGIPIKYVSEALRLCGDRFTVQALAKALGAEYEPAVVNRLIGLRYVKRDITGPRETLCLTDKGRRLSSAKGMRQLKREAADAILAELITKAQRVNGDDWFLHQVERIIVFGSYLNLAAARIPDLDVMVLLAPKEKDYERFSIRQAHKYRNSTRIFQPKFHPTFADYLDTLNFLGYRRRSLHLLPENEHWLMKKKTPHRVVFTLKDGVLPAPSFPVPAPTPVSTVSPVGVS